VNWFTDDEPGSSQDSACINREALEAIELAKIPARTDVGARPGRSANRKAWPAAGAASPGSGPRPWRGRPCGAGGASHRQLLGSAMQTSILRSVRLAWRQPDLGLRRRARTLLPHAAPVLGVVALVLGLLWGSGEYAERRAELRLAETSRHLEQFRSGAVGAAWARLRAAWQAEQDRQDALLARIASLHGAERARALRDHRMFVLETIAEYELSDEIGQVRRFVARLATCVRAGLCDADVAAAQLGPALWAFRDQHRYYFASEYGGHEVDEHVATIAPRAEERVIPAAARW